jgi:hypothetical protein
VTWTKLLADKETQRHKTSMKELGNMRALISNVVTDTEVKETLAEATAFYNQVEN